MINKYILKTLLLTMGIVTNIGATGNDASNAAYLIFNNTNSNSDKSIYTNLFTGYSNECSKESALYETNCNSFSLGNNELQIIQSDAPGNLINNIGVNNTNSTSYSNTGTDNQLNFFTPGQHIFDLDKFRNASNEIAKLSAGAPVGTYGTISFQQFISNVANARPMYGIVRVKIPLLKTVRTDEDDSKNKKEHEDKDDDHEKDGSKSKSDSEKNSSINLRDLSSFFIKESIASENEKERSKYVYKLCGEKPTPECSLCGPGIGTDIKPGQSVCGIKLNANSKILVYGSLFFDWVDCKTENPVSLADLPSRPRDIYFSISVPINVNPANVDPVTGTMASLSKIPQIIGNNKCPSGAPCSLSINTTVPISLISQEARDQYQYDTGKVFSESLFNSMTPAQKFNLLFPSGYENGWAKAFNTLGITSSYWQSLGFNTPSSTGFIDVNQVRSTGFEDIPAYMYTGGLVDMHHHVNISGLVYVPQAIELEQKGQSFSETQECTKVDQKHHEEDHDEKEKDDDSHSESNSEKSKMSSRSLTSRSSEEKESDDKEHEDEHDDEHKSACSSDIEKSDKEDSEHSENDDHHEGDSEKEHGSHHSGSNAGGSVTTYIPASQYINGMILVRDSFYIEAKQPGGVTIFNNDPNTYSNIILSTSSAIGGKFHVFPVNNTSGGSGNDDSSNSGGSENGNSSGGSSNSNGNGGSSSGGGNGNSGTSTPNRFPGAEWVEIHPQ